MALGPKDLPNMRHFTDSLTVLEDLKRALVVRIVSISSSPNVRLWLDLEALSGRN
jgi:hypothetical protein